MMPRSIMYSDYEWIKITLWVGVIFIVIPYSIYRGLKDLVKPVWIATVLAIGSPIANGIGSGIYHLKREARELKANGTWVKGLVIGKKFVVRARRSDYWAIKATYSVDGQEFETSWKKIRGEELYSENDEINIIYLRGYPKIYRIESDWIAP